MPSKEAVELLASAVPPDVADEVRAAHAADPARWAEAPAFRLVSARWRNLMMSRGLPSEDPAPAMERALGLRA